MEIPEWIKEGVRQDSSAELERARQGVQTIGEALERNAVLEASAASALSLLQRTRESLEAKRLELHTSVLELEAGLGLPPSPPLEAPPAAQPSPIAEGVDPNAWRALETLFPELEARRPVVPKCAIGPCNERPAVAARCEGIGGGEWQEFCPEHAEYFAHSLTAGGHVIETRALEANQ